MSRKEKVMLAIVAVAAEDCREAAFADPSEVKAVRALQKKGILKARKSGEKWAGNPVWYATYA